MFAYLHCGRALRARPSMWLEEVEEEEEEERDKRDEMGIGIDRQFSWKEGFHLNELN